MKSPDTNSAGCNQRVNITVIVLIHSPYVVQSRNQLQMPLKLLEVLQGMKKFKFEAGCEQSYE